MGHGILGRSEAARRRGHDADRSRRRGAAPRPCAVATGRVSGPRRLIEWGHCSAAGLRLDRQITEPAILCASDGRLALGATSESSHAPDITRVYIAPPTSMRRISAAALSITGAKASWPLRGTVVVDRLDADVAYHQ